MNGLDLEARTPTTGDSSIGPAETASEDPVLVAIDFSPDSEAALIWACDYAGRIGAPVEILHVIHDPADSPGTYKPDNGDPLEPMAEVAQRKLTGFLERVGDDNPGLSGLETAKTLCRLGLPASTILEVAQAHGARHLVLGGRRRNGFRRLVHGSTAGEVARHAELPVTIVKVDSR